MARQGDETEEFPQASWDAIRQAELFGITIGEKWGGAGLGDIEAAIVLEELGRADVSSAILAQLIFNGPPRAIEHLGTDELRDRWLPIAASGDGLFCIGISETEAGSAVGHMRARLTPDGDGFRLNAYKNYVTGGHKAVACLVWCRFPESVGTKGIGAVVVDLTAPGVTVTGTHVKMGLRATSEAELAFDDVRIEPSDVLLWGDPANSESFKTLISHINHERCGNAAMCIGAAQGALEYAVQYMGERRIGDKTLADFQGLQWKVADMATQLEGARLLLQRAVHMAGPHGTPPALETAMAKTAANLAAKFVCDEAIQLLGGYGFSREYPVERVYRDIRGLCIGAGHGRDPAQLHRHERAARRDAGQRRLEVAPGPSLTGRPRPSCSHRHSARRSRTDTGAPGGAWDRPSLDELLTGARRPTLADRVSRASRAGCARTGVEPGDAVAWQSANRDEVALLYRACWRLGAVAAPLHHQLGAAGGRAVAARRRAQARRRRSRRAARRPARHRAVDRRANSSRRCSSRRARAARPRACCTRRRRSRTRPRSWPTCTACSADDCVLMPAPCAHISGPAQRHHAAGRRAVPHRVHGALGSRGRARPHRTRARHVHGRSADVLRVAHAGTRLRAASGSRACG